MKDILEDCYKPFLSKYNFSLISDDTQKDTIGSLWKLSDKVGKGSYWIYSKENLFDIKIHDFFFYEDSIIEFSLPNCMSITYYDSISGEEFSPYRRLEAGYIKTFVGSKSPYRALLHKNIPIQSIGIEIMPAYYEDYLKSRYPEEYTSIYSAFTKMDQTIHFPEIIQILYQIKNYKGAGLAAQLFYDAKVSEILSLMIEHQKKLQTKPPTKLSESDIRQMENLTAYLNDHYASQVSLEQLSKIACMGLSKLKYCFKQYNNCSITEYIHQRRMGHAENLLANTNIPISLVSHTVGYSNPSRFAELFKKSTGLLPGQYRKMSQNIHP